MIDTLTQTIWYKLAAPGSHDRKISLPIEQFFKLATTSTSEAKFRASFLVEGIISPMTDSEISEVRCTKVMTVGASSIGAAAGGSDYD